MRKARQYVCAAGMLAVAAAVSAQPAATNYPNKPIRLIVGYTPGGGTDLASRYVAGALSDLWGATVLVDNRPGAGGAVGTELTARAAPDGYTIMLCTIGSHAITPARIKLPYDHIKDFSFLSLVGSTPNLFMAHPAQPFKKVGDVVAYAKANPGKLSFGSSGVGASPHLSIELLKSMTGINIVHVAYRGTAPAVTDLLAGQVQVVFDNIPGSIGHIKAGKLRALGVTAAKRVSALPNVPTIGETVPGYDANVWYGIAVPKDTPHEIVVKLNAAVNAVLKDPKLIARIHDLAADPLPMTPEEFGKLVQSETDKWAKVIAVAHIPKVE